MHRRERVLRRGTDAATRRELNELAAQRLRTHILVGLGCLMVLEAVVACLVTVAGGGVDPSLLIAFVPDVGVGTAVLWLVARRRLRPAVIVVAVYLSVNFLVLALQQDGYKLFATPWPLLPIVFGAYVAGPRLARWMVALFAVNAVVAIVVATTGNGLSTIALPSFDSAEGTGLAGLGAVVILSLVLLAERSRRRMQSELEATLAELDEQELRLHTLIDNTTDAIVLLDADCRVLAANQSAEDLAAALVDRKERFVGQSFLDVVASNRRHIWEQRFGDCARTGHGRIEEVMSTRSGETHLETSLHAIVAHDLCAGFTLVARDITERREAEVTLQRLRGQLLDASRLAGRAEMAAGMLHNVGNVVTSVQVSAGQVREIADGMRVEGLRRALELLHELLPCVDADDRPTKLMQFLTLLGDQFEQQRAQLCAESDRLEEQLEHIRAILRVQRAFAHRQAVVEEIDVEELVQAALPLDDGWRDADVELQCEVERPTPRLLCDRHRLLQILVNLLRNARDAVRDKPKAEARVRVHACTTDSGGVRISVCDNGVGIDPELSVSLFSHGFTTKPDGNGFGLHASANLATELGGTLRFESDGVGRGAAFHLDVPAAPPDQRQAA